MKGKKFLTLVLSGVIITTSFPTSIFAEDFEENEVIESQEVIEDSQEDSQENVADEVEETNQDEVVEETQEDENIEETQETDSDDINSDNEVIDIDKDTENQEVEQETAEDNSENNDEVVSAITTGDDENFNLENSDDNYNISVLADSFTENLVIYKENEDVESSAGNYFTKEKVAVREENGKYKVRLAYTNSMIGEISQVKNGETKVLEVTEENGEKYVEFEIESLEEIAYIGLKINTPMGAMSHIVRVFIEGKGNGGNNEESKISYENLVIYKENEDVESSAGNYFTKENAIVKEENGKYKVRLAYTNSMIGEISQVKNGETKVLEVTEENGEKYVEFEIESLEETAYIGLKVNTPMGAMSHIVRVFIEGKGNGGNNEESKISYENLVIYKENEDVESSAGNYFTKENAIVKEENGKYKVRLAYTNSMIGEISQVKNGETKVLEVTEENGEKYVEFEIESLEETAYIGLKVNTPMGAMSHIVRVFIEGKGNGGNNQTPENPDDENKISLENGTYSIPVTMVKATDSSATSMGNDALDGNATVKVVDGKYYVDINVKGVSMYGMYTHLTNLWSYTGDEYDSSQWGVGEISATIVSEYEDYGTGYPKGDETKSKFAKTFRIERSSETGYLSEQIPVRIEIDALSGHDNPAILKLDYSKAEKIEDKIILENGTYSVPVTMVKATDSSATSMGNDALDGNATVKVVDGKYYVDINVKGVSMYGMYTHLTNLWSYVGNEYDSSQWGVGEIPATIVSEYEDYGTGYPKGDETKSKFAKTFRIERSSETGYLSEQIPVRIEIDALSGHDNPAILKLDYSKAEKIEDNNTIENGKYKATIKILKEKTDDTSSASTYFTTKDVPIQIENGKAKVKLEYTSSMIEGLAELNSDEYQNLEIYSDGESKYVFINIDSIDEAQYVKVRINTGTSFGIMENIFRVLIDKDSFVKDDNSSDDDATKVVSTPVINVSNNNAKNGEKVTVEINNNTDNAKIYYTLDGSEPNENSVAYNDKFEITGINQTINIKAIAIKDGFVNSNIASQSVKFSATSSSGGGGSSSSDSDIDATQDGKYWVSFSLWNASADQASMGDLAFENNREALLIVENGKYTVQMASNPVEITGFTSALAGMQYKYNGSYNDVKVLGTSSFTTSDAFDGQAHSFKYLSKFEFNIENVTDEYVDVKINVPYTPMEGVMAGSGGYLDARLKFSWGSISKASANASINANTSSSSSSSSISITSSAFDKTDDKTGVRIVANENVVYEGSELNVEQITSGEDFKKAEKALAEVVDSFKLYNILIKNNGSNSTPVSNIKIYIPINSEDNSENSEDNNQIQNKVVVYRINANGTKTAINGTIEDNYFVIETSTLGLFALGQNNSEDNTEEVSDIEEVEEISATEVEETEKTFTDIENHWAKDSINYMLQNGIFNGTSENKFEPNKKMTRAMFITVLGRMANAKMTNSSTSFNDIDENDYYFEYVNWAYENGIISGVSENKFAPHDTITREQMAVILNNFIKYQGIELKPIYKNDFSDDNKISSWAKESVNTLAESGIIMGMNNGQFAPNKGATRAECASMLMRFIQR